MDARPPSCHPAFQRLRTRVEPLGNLARKYLRAVERHGEHLLERLEATGTLSHVHLDRTAAALAEDFERVAATGRSSEEKLVLLGTYYAVQFLHQNARALERLAVDLAEKNERLRSYAALLERTEEEFSLLVSTYVQHVLRIVLPPAPPRFAILNVGTRGHQDDIDVAVIYCGGGNRAELDGALARLTGQCLRYASPLDNYVAVQAGAEGFCLSPGELRQALRSGRLGYVVVTELLRAELLAGDAEALERLRREVTAEYLFRPGHDSSRHELYLRGLLGETRALLLHPPPPDRVNPKDDALRLIMGFATAFKVIEGVKATQPGNVLAELIVARPQLHDPLSRLEQSRIFLETFRQVAQLLVSQEEEIAVEGEPARENLARVAAALGYRNWGPVQAVDHLLVHYHEAVEATRAAAVTLMDEVASHLTGISCFSRWARGPLPEDLALEFARALAATTRAFSGVRFYDDVVDAFAAPGGSLIEAFASSFSRLAPERRHELAELYAEWGRDAPYAFISILTLLASRSGRARPVDVAAEIADAFLSGLPSSPEAVRALSRVFRSYPALANRFLFALSPARLDRLAAAIEVPIGNPEVAAARDRLRSLIRVHRQSSLYIRRVLARVTERHPATVQAISDNATLRTLALGQLAASERHPSHERQKGLLGDYYDIEFLRIAIGTLRGEPDARTRTAFAELTATYLDRLFGFCCREAEHRAGWPMPDRDRIGVFLSGGNARGRPYDEDYDLLVLIDSADPADQRFAEHVIVLMNRQIARRGVIAQYRLGEWLGRYATTFDELSNLLARDEDDLFVDRCQLLGSRMTVGSRRIEEQLLSRVLTPYIFGDAEHFTARVARELSERRQSFRLSPPGTIHLKENPGGLRETDLCLAIAQARLGVWDARGIETCDELARRDPARSILYQQLRTIYDFLVAVRSAYRVSVSATDEIEREHLAAPARILGYEGRDAAAAALLFTDLEHRLADSALLVDELAGLAHLPPSPSPAATERL